MAQQLKKKFLGNNQVDGQKILLENGQAIRAKDSSGVEQDLIKLGASDEVLVKGQEVALDADLQQEVTDRQNADSAIQSELDATQAGAGLGTDGSYSPNTFSPIIATATSLKNADDYLDLALQNVITLTGSSVNDQDLGSFTGTTIPDNQSIKSALQSLETAIEAVSGGSSSTQTELDATQVGAGLNSDGSYSAPVGSNYLGSAVSLKDADSKLDTEIKSVADDVAALETYVDATFVPLSQKGAANGVATLGSDGKIPSSQVPSIAITDVYVVADIAARDALSVEEGDVAKVSNAGSGLPKTYIYDGSAWVEIESGSDVDSVFGRTGAVVATFGDYSASLISYGASSNVEAKLDSLQSEIDAEEIARASADSALDGRIDALEAVVWFKEKFSISNGQTSVTLSHSPIANSMSAWVDRLAIHEGASEDFTVSGTTMTFLNDLVSPGQSSLGNGDTVYVKYQYSV